MPALGVGIALIFDLLLPAAVTVWLVRSNWQHRWSTSGEKVFWAWFGSFLGFFAMCVLAALPRIWWYDALGVVTGTIFAAPGSVIPALFNSNVIHFFFTNSEWAHYGYFIVTTLYSVGLIFWFALTPLAIRRLSQRRTRVAPVSPPAPAPPAA